jgi:hypothetical protein
MMRRLYIHCGLTNYLYGRNVELRALGYDYTSI